MTTISREMLLLVMDIYHNMLILLMAMRVEGIRIRPLRIAAAAVLGAVGASAFRLAQTAQPSRVVVCGVLALAMSFLAGGRRLSVRQALLGGAVVLACAGFLGGTILALYGATGSLAAAQLLSAIPAAFVFTAALRSRRASASATNVCVKCSTGGKVISFEAIVDSGNSLRDYMTGRPVVVVTEKLLGRYEHAGSRMRLIFADTAGGRQMMQMTVPDRTEILLDGKWNSVDAALAFSPGLRQGMPALVPSMLIDTGKRME